MKTIAKIRPGIILKQVNSKIFALKFSDSYEMCMTFLRYQEYYESPASRFRGKVFSILDYMAWYSKKYGNGAFTYPRDWDGFNIPSETIAQLQVEKISDLNHYDQIMNDVYQWCIKKTDKFYLIGICGKCKAFDHEMAHGLYYTVPGYKKEVHKLVSNIPKTTKRKMKEKLSKMGYAVKTHEDEIQAYLSTGPDSAFNRMKLQKICEPFIENFNKYYKGKKL